MFRIPLKNKKQKTEGDVTFSSLLLTGRGPETDERGTLLRKLFPLCRRLCAGRSHRVRLMNLGKMSAKALCSCQDDRKSTVRFRKAFCALGPLFLNTGSGVSNLQHAGRLHSNAVALTLRQAIAVYERTGPRTREAQTHPARVNQLPVGQIWADRALGLRPDGKEVHFVKRCRATRHPTPVRKITMSQQLSPESH
ncbi:hypothetical protein SKAU_G00013480 [Synaphobranchus kaupii]|uniref:Uncharacterized protein n=1 Tax=Synaphobranchus kaupii TaxID=118154 RepID=A0A9Q1GAF5_SYNKA|nr:hypothetical protein SKAU_G00013480 [Synaphobranchus kaupii]